METKFCNGCKQEVELIKFSKKSNTKDGLRSRCKECENVASKLYQNNNREKVLAQKRLHHLMNIDEERAKGIIFYNANIEKCRNKQKVYRENNLETVKASSKKSKEKTKEHTKAHKKVFNEAHKEEISAYKKIYNELNKVSNRKTQIIWMNNHKEEISLSKRIRESKQKNLPATLTLEQWQGTKEYFNNRCAYCDRELPLTKDHFKALNMGGEYTINNIIPACRTCNSSKNDGEFLEWYPKYKYYSKLRESKILKFLNYDKNKIQQLTLAL